MDPILSSVAFPLPLLLLLVMLKLNSLRDDGVTKDQTL
jgi:hypothetical protein